MSLVRNSWALGMVLALGGCAFEDTGLMTQQPKYKPYDASPHFGDGRTMRQPPAGTVAWEYRELKPEWKKYRVGEMQPADPASGNPMPPGTPTDAAHFVTRNPVPLTRLLLDTGRAKFNVYCAPCHGLTGDGNSLVAENMGSRPPPNLIPYRDAPAGYLYAVITEGYGYMNSYAASLSVEERWAVVAYLNVLQRSQSVPAASAPPEWRSKVEAR